jgi:hypothetical protein
VSDYLTDDDIIATPEKTILNRPEYVGLVSAVCTVRLEAGDVTEYALVVLQDGEACLFEMSTEDFRCLGKQITRLIGD